jgi:hypothetical protein
LGSANQQNAQQDTSSGSLFGRPLQPIPGNSNAPTGYNTRSNFAQPSPGAPNKHNHRVTWLMNKLLETNDYLSLHDITIYSILLNSEPPSTTTSVFTGLDPNNEHRLYVMALDIAATVGYRPRHEYDTVEADYRRAPQQVLRLHGYIRMGIVGQKEVHRLLAMRMWSRCISRNWTIMWCGSKAIDIGCWIG